MMPDNKILLTSGLSHIAGYPQQWDSQEFDLGKRKYFNRIPEELILRFFLERGIRDIELGIEILK